MSVGWILLLSAGLVLLASAVLTGVLRRHALHARLLDLPNARSSHTQPTPHGGGLAIVASFSLGLCGFWLLDLVSSPVFAAAGAGGLLLAVVGYVDDRHSLPARWRFLAHLLAGGWTLWCLGGFPTLPVSAYQLDFGWLGIVIGVLLIVWLLNLYNFMDGIDGIAGVETLTVAGGAALLLWASGEAASAAQLVLLAAAALGFLLWNWPPAKIFMGDVGSAFLGFVLAVFALATSMDGSLNIWVWLILLGVFIVDATLTLLRRLLRGERWYEAHRSHAYQRAARQLSSHLKVTLAVGVLNVLWLLPLAWFASARPEHGWWLTGLAYLPLTLIALRLGAGTPEPVGGVAADERIVVRGQNEH